MHFSPHNTNTPRPTDFVRPERAVDAHAYEMRPGSKSAPDVSQQAHRIVASRSKRALDVALGGALLIGLAPVLGAIALAIKFDTQGPVFFRQQRYGANRRVFKIWKFRTMRVMEAEGAFVQAAQQDTRVTRVGRWLRSTSLDEVPQLFNVVAGSMSLVGPRPHAVVMDDHFARVIPSLPLRHLVRPGITGLAQVSGFRGPTADAEAMAQRVDKDVAYIADWSISKDVSLLLRTPAALLRTTAF